jgi:hypothetical protein
MRWVDDEAGLMRSTALEASRLASGSKTGLFDVVGEQYCIESIEAAVHAVDAANSFLPVRFWILCESDNPNDPDGVSVHAAVEDRTYRVGYLPRSDARLYRDGLVSIGRSEETIEVIGCFAQSQNAVHPNVLLNLPRTFAAQLAPGHGATPPSESQWLDDPTPVEPRPFRGPGARGFTDDELRKIHCWYAKRKLWVCLPDDCDAALAAMRSTRIPESLTYFLLDPECSATPSTGLAVFYKPRSEEIERPKNSCFAGAVVEEQIDLPGSVLEREDPRGYDRGPIVGSVHLTVVRRTSLPNGDRMKVEGLLRLTITDDRKRSPLVQEIALSGLRDTVLAICQGIHAVDERATSRPNSKVAVRLSKKVAIVACTGERMAWKMRTSKVELFLQTGALEYVVVQEELLLNSLIQAAQGGRALQEVADHAIARLRRPSSQGW